MDPEIIDKVPNVKIGDKIKLIREPNPTWE